MSLSPRLVDVAPELEALLNGGSGAPPRYAREEIRRETVQVTMRDGIRLATDVYLPPALPAPVVVVRTPPGSAHVVGSALDRASLPGLLGNVAGDDTLIVVCSEKAGGQTVARKLSQLAGL